jgi:membrane protease YdiL (CAAX protease family)
MAFFGSDPDGAYRMIDESVSTAATNPKLVRRLAFLALLLLVPAPSIGTVCAMWLMPGPVGQAIYGFCKVWLLGFPLFWLHFVERRRWSLSPVLHGGLGAGLLLGVALGGFIIGCYGIFGRDIVDTARLQQIAQQVGIGTPASYLGLAFYLTFINSLLEEYVWRWFVFRRCEDLTSSLPAVILSAFFFMIHHSIALAVQFGWALTLSASLGVFVSGMIWSGCYLRFRSIWPGYVSHILADAAIFLVGWWLIFGKN